MQIFLANLKLAYYTSTLPNRLFCFNIPSYQKFAVPSIKIAQDLIQGIFNAKSIGIFPDKIRIAFLFFQIFFVMIRHLDKHEHHCYAESDSVSRKSFATKIIS